MMFDTSLPQPNDSFRWVQAEAGPALVCSALEPVADHLFTTRVWPLGSSTADRPWDDVARAMRVEVADLVRVRQVHGETVVVCRAGAARADAPTEGDIIIGDDPAAALAIQSADCVPLLLGDRRRGAVAAAHAGWRGLAAGVPGAAVRALMREFGSRPEDLVAAIGPSISAARYEVGTDVRDRFEASGVSVDRLQRWFAAARRPDHWYFDGWQAARDQLEAAGVEPAQIFVAGLCTAEHVDLFCSFRRDGTGTGRLAAAIRPAAGRRAVSRRGD